MRNRRKPKFLSSFFPSKKQRNDLKLRNRMKICALSVFIMWASSLNVAVYIASLAIDVPSILTAFKSCRSAFHLAIDEKNMYATCVNAQLSQCNNDAELAIELELDRGTFASNHNDEVVKHMLVASNNCADSYIKLSKTLETWMALNEVIPIDNTSCSEDEQEMVLKNIRSIDAFKTEAFSVSEKFEETSRTTLNHMVDFAKRRIDYDQKYLLNHSKIVRKFLNDEIVILPFNISTISEDITDVIETMTSCMSLKNSSTCTIEYDINSTFVSVKTLAEKFKQESFDSYTEKIQVFQTYYNEMNTVLEDFRNDLMPKVDKWIKFYGDAVAVIDAMRDKLGSVSGKSVDLFAPVSMESLMPPDLILPPLLSPTHLIDAVNNAYNENFQSIVQNATDYYLKEISKGFENINEIYTNWTDEVGTIYNIEALGDLLIPDDYNPPSYVGTSQNITDINQELERFTDASEFFVLDASQTINNLANATSASNEVDNVTGKFSSMGNLTTFRTKVAGFDMTFEDFMTPRVDFNLWLLDVIAAGDIVFLIDFAVRLYFTIRMCFKYWSVSSVKIPHVDVRTETDLASNPLEWNNGRVFVAFISNPLTGFLLACIIISWIVTFTTSIYIPIFDEYRNGCIPQGANGTFISENIYSSAYNYAYNEGSSTLVAGMEFLEKNRTNACSKFIVPSTQKQNEDMRQFFERSQLIANVQNQMNIFGNCIDSDLLDQFFFTACCNLPGYNTCNSTNVSNFTCPLSDDQIAFPSPGRYLRRDVCDFDIQNEEMKLQNAIFDCRELPTCNITCSGPRKDKLRRVTKECSCIGQWLFHSYWLRAVLSVVIFAILNISRVTFIDGLAKILWKSLHPGSFTVFATCDESGSITGQNDKQNEQQQHSTTKCTNTALTKSIVDQLEINSLKFRMGGLIMVIGSILLNILWLTILLKIRGDLSMKWL